MTAEKPVVLVVDDAPDNIALASSLLKSEYKVKVATNGAKALQIVKQAAPDLILLDVMMPVLDGYETCRQLQADPVLADIPVIFLTARQEQEDEAKGLALGAVDYITKPLNPAILLSRVKTHIKLHQAQQFFRDKASYLEAEVARRMKEISLIQEVSIVAMASLAETRSNETGAHIQRTAAYVRELALFLQNRRGYRDVLTPENIQLLVRSAPLHDIGKVGIPDSILLKQGKLTVEEFAVMKTHAAIGRDAIRRAELLLGTEESFLQFAKEIAQGHHEKWDGSGYPDGLAGEDIPLSARLMALADVYDALISRRVYKDPYPHSTAVRMIEAESGTHFDPVVVEAFLALEGRFLEIAEAMRDIKLD